MKSNTPQEPVAIVGVGCRYPGGIIDPDHFWRVLSRGEDLIQDIPPDRFDAGALYDPRPGKRGKIAHTQGGFLEDVDRFDAKFFKIAPREARFIDPQHRLLLETSYEALCDAGILRENPLAHSTGVFVGIWSADYESRMQRSLDDLDVYVTNGGGRYTAAGRIAFAFDFRGPAFIVDTACSSSLVSVHLACQSLRSGESDLALAGGVNLILAPYVSVGYSRSRMLSTYARCRFGNAEPGGYVRSEGAGMIALKLLSHAIRDDDRVYAVIRGSAVNNDGKASELLVQPAVDGQAAALESAYRAAGVDPAKVDYVECHGTGTRAGDPVEVEALSRILGPGRDPARPLLLGSVKTNFGHTEAASGVAGLIKTALSLHNRRVPPSLHFSVPNPAIPWDTLPVRIASEPVSFPDDRKALAGVNSFGISATNAHVVLEEFELRRSRAAIQHPTPLILSAADSHALRDQLFAWKNFLTESESDLSDIIYTANLRRTHFKQRFALVGRERKDFIRALEKELEAPIEDSAEESGGIPDGRSSSGEHQPGLVFVFSGQGPRFWPFAYEQLNQSDVFRETLKRCDQVLKDLGGWSLLEELARPHESSVLTQTQYTQPALCSIQIALSEFWRACGAIPDAVVGHSMGEVPAAYVAGALSLEDAMRVIFQRGRLIQTVCGAGKMAFVEMAPNTLEQKLTAYAGVTIAAVNSPGNTIVSGASTQIEALIAALSKQGVFCKILESVDFASHSPQMESIQPAMESALKNAIRPRESSLAFYSTVTGSQLPGAELGAEYWARNIREPVRFAETIQALAADLPGVFLEISPHPAMTGSITRCLEDAAGESRALFSLKRDEVAGASLAAAAGELYCAGIPLRLAAFTPRANVTSLPIYSYQKKRYWIDESRAPLPEQPRGRKIHRIQWRPLEPTADREPPAIAAADSNPAGLCLILATGENEPAHAFAELCERAGHEIRIIPHASLSAARSPEELKAQANPIAVFDFRVRPAGEDRDAAAGIVIDVVSTLRTLASRAADLQYWLITEGAVNAGLSLNDEADLVLSTVQGFMKSLQLEQPELTPRHIDLEARQATSTTAQADLIFELFSSQSAENQIALRGGRTFVARLAEEDLPAAPVRWQANEAGVYLITGGAGNIGLAVARWLVERGARNLYLTGRRDLASDQERSQAVRLLESSGARVRYFVADIGDSDATREIFDECDREGLSLRGIVHAAGVFNEVPAKDLEAGQIREIFHAKTNGARVLDELSAGRSLDFFILFSSAAAIWGSHGLAHYGAANSFLDALSIRRRRRGLPALSINWGLWEGDGMVAGDVREKWERAGIRAMPIHACLQNLEAILTADRDGCVVADFDLQRLRALLESRQPISLFSGMDSPVEIPADVAPEDTANPGANPKPREDLAATLKSLSTEPRRDLLQNRLGALAREVLGMSGADEFEGTAGFFQQGMDSLMAVQFAQKISRAVGSKLNTAIVFDFPSVVALSEHLTDLFEQNAPDQTGDALPAESSVATTTEASTLASGSKLTSSLKSPSRPADDQGVAVIGMGCRFPGNVRSPQEFWEVLINGQDCITPIPPERWAVDDYYDSEVAKPGKINTRSGGFLSDVDQFDANFFGISPREAMSMDPQQRLTLEACWEAIENAGIPATKLRGSRTGVYMGVTMTDYYDLQKKNNDARLIDGYTGTGGFLNSVSGRVSYFFGLHGPSMAVDAACASSLVSVHLAARSVRNGECDLALAGGVNLILAPDAFVFLSAAGALAPDGRCKTFDAAADGLGRAEGVGVLLFKRLADARRDGDRILGVIRGTAVGQDGPSGGLTVPNGQAQQKVIREALADAGIEPNGVDLVEAHGTGTRLGDPIEFNALAGVYGKDRNISRPLYIGSVKTTIGHAESAAGVAGLMKVLLSLQNKEIPPHLHFNEANPRIELDRIPARVPTDPTPWPNSSKRRAGVSAFGVSGTLAHIIVEEASPEVHTHTQSQQPRTHRNRPERDVYLLPLSAASEISLQQSARELLQWLDERPEMSLYDLCHTAALRRSHHRRRLAIVFRDRQELRNILEHRVHAQNFGELPHGKAVDITNKPVFVFSGHGSQWPGMGRDLSASEPVFREALEACAAELQALLDWSFFDELFASEGQSRLSEAFIAQPLIFAMQVSLAKLWQSRGIEPGAVLGHSMGEVAAAHIAGHLSLKDAALLIVTRSRLASRLSGRMLSINLGRSAAEDILRTDQEFARKISIGSSNGPASTVVSGDADALERLAGELEKRDIYASFVKVSLAGHSPQVDSILPELIHTLRNIQPQDGAIPFYSTVSGLSGRITAGSELTAEYWSWNLRRSVLFWDTIEALRSEQRRDFIEVSPHPLLLPGLPVEESAPAGVTTLRRNSDSLREFYTALGEMFVRGYAPDWDGLYPAGEAIDLPAYPFERRSYWFDSDDGPPSSSNGFLTPLLGSRREDRRKRSRRGRAFFWEREISLAGIAWARDHRVQDSVLLPGAAFIETVLSAACDAFGPDQTISIKGMRFRNALFLLEDDRCRLQCAIFPSRYGDHAFQILSRKTGEEDWITHCEGEIHSDSAIANETLDWGRVRERARESYPSADFYASWAREGVQWGPGFQTQDDFIYETCGETENIESSNLSGESGTSRADREIYRLVDFPETIASERSIYSFHPALLDLCLQATNAAVGLFASKADGLSGAALFHSMEEFILYRPLKETKLITRARLRASAEGQDRKKKTCDISVFTLKGELVASATGVCIQFLEERIDLFPKPYLNWLYEIEWADVAPAVRAPSHSNAHWLIFADSSGVGEAVVQRLREFGNQVYTVHPGESYGREADRFTIHPDRREDYQRLLKEIKTVEGFSQGASLEIVHLWTLDCPANEELFESPSLSQIFERAARMSCGSLLNLLQCTTSDAQTRIRAVSRGALAPDGGEPRVNQSPLWGFGRSADAEREDQWRGLIDCDPRASVADTVGLLTGELLAQDGEQQICLRDGRRLGARLKRSLPVDDPAPIEIPGGAWLITGGFGALGLRTARHLAERQASHIILAGRRPAPPRAEWESLARDDDSTGSIARALLEIESLGARVLGLSVDVGDEAAVQDAIQSLEDSEWLPIRGIIHAAGISHVAAIEDQSFEQLQKDYRAKVLGSYLLHKHLPATEYVVYFSSGATVLNSPLLSTYAAANAFMDALAHYRRTRGENALAVNWGYWTGVGMAVENYADKGEELTRGIGGFTPEQGVQVLEYLMRANATQAAVMPIDWQRWAEFNPEKARSPFYSRVLRVPGASHETTEDMFRETTEDFFERTGYHSASGEEQLAIIGEYAKTQLAQVLRIDAAELDPNQAWNQLGFDSLMAVDLKRRIERDLGANVPMVSFLKGISLVELAKQLHQLMPRGDDTFAVEGPEEFRDRRLRAPRQDFPLSHSQHGYWLFAQIAPENPFYITPMALHFRGGFDEARFLKSLRTLVAEHSILRTYFPIADASPVQCPLAEFLPEPKIIDLRGRTHTRKELDHKETDHLELQSEINEHIRRDAREPFQLKDQPPFRVTLMRVAEDEWIALITMHHIICDGLSLSLIAARLGEIYRSDRAPRPGEQAVQYCDYVLYQHEVLDPARLALDLEYWKNHLQDAPLELDYPTDFPIPETASYKGALFKWEPDETLAKQLATAGQEQGLTLFMSLLSLVALKFHEWTGCNELLLGTVANNRDREVLKDMPGDFTNFLSLRIKFDPDQTLQDFMLAVRETVLAAYSHQQAPFAQVVEQLKVRRRPGRNPIYNAAFLLHDETAYPPADFGSEVTVQADYKTRDLAEIAVLDLRIEAIKSESGIRLDMEYSTDLYREKTIAAWMESFGSLARIALDHTQQSLREILAMHQSQTRLPAFGLKLAATFTADPLLPRLQGFLESSGVDPDMVAAEPYSQVMQFLLQENLHQAANVVLVRPDDWLPDSNPANLPAFLNTAREFEAALSRLSSQRLWLVAVCPSTPALERRLGPEWDRFEERLRAILPADCLIARSELQTDQDDPARIHNPHGDRIAHLPYTDFFMDTLAGKIARKLYQKLGRPIKAIAVDCDNTLWRGVAADEGPVNVIIDQQNTSLLTFLKEKRAAGVLLCLVSKSTVLDVQAVFARDDFPLSMQDITSHRIGPGLKSDGILAIASELNLNAADFLFIDDDAVECAEVATRIRDIPILQWPAAERIDRVEPLLSSLRFFLEKQTTDEDALRSQFYLDERGRNELRSAAPSFEEFLKGLDLKIATEPLAPENSERAAQLTLRTNQFNFSGERFSAEQLQELARKNRTGKGSAGNVKSDDDKYVEQSVELIRVRDRFGDYGFAGLLLYSFQAGALVLHACYLSCRVLGRGVEHEVFRRLGRKAIAAGIQQLVIQFSATTRNERAQNFLESIGAKVLPGGYGLAANTAVELQAADSYQIQTEKERPKAIAKRGEFGLRLNADWIANSTQVAQVAEAIPTTAMPSENPGTKDPAETSPGETDTESTICQAWAELLGVEHVRPTDDFFEMGGNSLQAAQFASRSLFRVEITLNDIFSHPTAGKLSKLIAAKTDTDSDTDGGMGSDTKAAANSHSRFGAGDRLEERIAKDWADLLGRDSIGMHDDFFESGGNSLQAAQFVATGRYGETLTLNDMFQHSTVVSLGALLRKRDGKINE